MDGYSKSSRGDRLYHYTNDEGLRGIQQSQQINPSTDTYRDAHFGEGVYLTGKTPRSRAENLLKNNYDGMNPGRSGAERVKHAISIPISDLPDAEKCSSRGRDVWKNPGPIDLTQVDYKVHHKNIGKSSHSGSSKQGESHGYWNEAGSSSSGRYGGSVWERPSQQWDSSRSSTGNYRSYSENSQSYHYGGDEYY